MRSQGAKQIILVEKSSYNSDIEWVVQFSAVNFSAVQCGVVQLCAALPCTATHINALSNYVWINTALKCSPIPRQYELPAPYHRDMNNFSSTIS